jgi:hypothetical protein
MQFISLKVALSSDSQLHAVGGRNRASPIAAFLLQKEFPRLQCEEASSSLHLPLVKAGGRLEAVEGRHLGL